MHREFLPSLAPIILIAVGIVAMLVVTGRIGAGSFWTWYSQWWPLLLIVAGLALMGEWALDLLPQNACAPQRQLRRHPHPALHRRRWRLGMEPHEALGQSIGAIMTTTVSTTIFSIHSVCPSTTLDAQVLSSQIPANSVVDIQNPRGDISVTAGDGPNIEVRAHEVAFANSDDEAKKIFDAEAAHVTVSGNSVVVKSDSNNDGRINLTVTVPKSARVSLNAGRGDVTVAGVGEGVNVTAQHGDVHLSAISGPVEMHFSGGKHDFSAHQVNGDLTTDGDCNDLTLSEIKGKITQNGEILGDVHIENVTGPIHLHTSVTDLQVADLPGDITLNSDDLRVSEAKGAVHVITRSKDVDLSEIYGDTHGR